MPGEDRVQGEVRWLLVQAAVPMRRVRHPATAALRAWALGIATRRGRFIAVVALARRLAGILYAMLRDGTRYEPASATRAPGAATGTPGGARRLGPDAEGPAGLPDLRTSAARCRACELWQHATQTVFGEGPASAEIMLVGEQPGHDEDLAGRPFVGPAGRLLDEALEAAGLDRKRIYVTNLVKHFYWEPRGKWRIHKKPTAWHVRACRPWLDAELAAVRPRALVCLGATAAQALLGRGVRVTQSQGRPIPSPLAPHVFATLHPSAVLRAPDDAARRASMERLVGDLATVARLLAAEGTADGSGPHRGRRA